MAELRVLSTLGLAGVMRALTPQFQRTHGVELSADFAPTLALMRRIADGEQADAAILTAEAMTGLIERGTIRRDGRADLARSVVGIAVRAGAPHPDIGTVDAFIATMLAAKSVALSKAGRAASFSPGCCSAWASPRP